MASSNIMLKRWSRRRVPLMVVSLLTTIVYFYFCSSDPTIPPLKNSWPSPRPKYGSHQGSHMTEKVAPYAITLDGEDDGSVEMVIASLKHQNTTWLHNHLSSWKKNIYVMDDSEADLTIPKNKGKEAMVFLTYIIDRYYSLPDNIFFHRAERFQWYNDNPDYDALALLQRFRLSYLKEQGYVNMRCDWALGCPSAIRPYVDAIVTVPGEGISPKHIYKKSFEKLFPDLMVPETVGVACCGQFAVRRTTIRRRPRADCVRYRKWLMNTDLDDGLAARVFEYSWHIMFGKKAMHCPNAGTCYCKMYGLCGMKCDAKHCEGQYTLPRFSNLPEGWPRIGWKKEARPWLGPE